MLFYNKKSLIRNVVFSPTSFTNVHYMLCVSFEAAQDDTPDVDSRLFSFCHSLELFFQLYRIVRIDVPLSKDINTYEIYNVNCSYAKIEQ